MVSKKGKVDARRAFRKLMQVEKLLYKKTDETAENLAKRGKYMAREIAPFDSSRTAKFIRVIQLKGAETSTWMIQAMSPTKGGANRKFKTTKYPDFNLVRWMHETNGIFRSDNPYGKAGTKHITSGEPRFMYVVEEHLNRIKNDVAKGTFKNIKIK